jgi:hypothetical protein
MRGCGFLEVGLVPAPLGAWSCNRGGLPSVFYEEEMV